MDYNKIIKDNADSFRDSETLSDFIDNYNYDNKTIDELEDCITEDADGLVPIYYYEIVKEWQENGECHDLAQEIFGENTGETIHEKMQQDLFCYYEQELRTDFNILSELVDELDD